MANRGSQCQIQIQVNSRREEFDALILSLLSLPKGAKLQWVSPLAEDHYDEYQDVEFLQKLKLERYSEMLKEFWPRSGPCWDALAIVEDVDTRGVVLVEAKSHISEMVGACRAAGKHREQIKTVLSETAQDIGAEFNLSWIDHYYQLANRYAHLYFFRKKLNVPAWLIQVYFVNDHSIDHVEKAPCSADMWREALNQVKERMGISPNAVPFSHTLFIEAVAK